MPWTSKDATQHRNYKIGDSVRIRLHQRIDLKEIMDWCSCHTCQRDVWAEMHPTKIVTLRTQKQVDWWNRHALEVI